nr:MAG TPA: hypothetical protein [Caudoviricetes sp.]
MSQETRTPLNYWLDRPLYEWIDWIDSVSEILEEKKGR